MVGRASIDHGGSSLVSKHLKTLRRPRREGDIACMELGPPSRASPNRQAGRYSSAIPDVGLGEEAAGGPAAGARAAREGPRGMRGRPYSGTALKCVGLDAGPVDAGVGVSRRAIGIRLLRCGLGGEVRRRARAARSRKTMRNNYVPPGASGHRYGRHMRSARCKEMNGAPTRGRTGSLGPGPWMIQTYDEYRTTVLLCQERLGKVLRWAPPAHLPLDAATHL
jgi:hypothetical protein